MKRVILPAALVISLTIQAAAETVVVREGDTWSYFRGWTAPPADWTSLEFDASTWESGATGIGYADDDDATILADMANGYWAVFLRIVIDVPEAMAGAQWVLRARYDDGFVAYVDGAEAARRGLTGVPPAFDEASGTHEILAATGFDETIPLSAEATAVLTPGRHVLAVEVHNATIDSTDLSFSAELVAYPFTVTSVEPAFGPVEGGNQVTLRGQGFDPAGSTTVRFGGIASTSITVLSGTEIEAQVPAGTAGTADVTVEDGRGTFVLAGGYRYALPGRPGLIFDSGDAANAAPFPDGLAEGTIEMWFRRENQGGFNRWPVLVAIDEPGGTDAFRLEVRGTGIRTRTWVNGEAQNVTATATLDVATWHHVAVAFSGAGRRVLIDGVPLASDAVATSFQAGARLRLGAGFGNSTALLGGVAGLRIWSAVRDDREIARDIFARYEEGDGLFAAWYLEDGNGQTAADALGRSELTLGNSTGAEENDPQWYSFEDFPAVAVTGLDPAAGSIEGGEEVTIFGTGFDGPVGPTVEFGGVAAESVTVNAPWELVAIVPPGTAMGRVDVTVRTSRGTATRTGGYLYEPGDLHSFVEEGDLWNYFIGDEAADEGWNGPDFDPADYGWPQGPGGLGYGDGDDATDLPQMLNGALTLYVRRSWEMPEGLGEIQYLLLRVRYDDGFVAYLNGTEVARRNVAGSPPTFDEPASDLHEILGGIGTFDEEIDLQAFRNLLRAGTNVLAIEAHNESADSSDLSVAAELVYVAAAPPGTAFLRGDVDMNGRTTVTDPIWLLNGLFSQGPLPCMEAADINDSGTLTVTDPILLLRYLFAGGAPPAPPIDDPMPDLDGDALDCKG